MWRSCLRLELVSDGGDVAEAAVGVVAGAKCEEAASADRAQVGPFVDGVVLQCVFGSGDRVVVSEGDLAGDLQEVGDVLGGARSGGDVVGEVVADQCVELVGEIDGCIAGELCTVVDIVCCDGHGFPFYLCTSAGDLRWHEAHYMPN